MRPVCLAFLLFGSPKRPFYFHGLLKYVDLPLVLKVSTTGGVLFDFSPETLSKGKLDFWSKIGPVSPRPKICLPHVLPAVLSHSGKVSI